MPSCQFFRYNSYSCLHHYRFERGCLSQDVGLKQPPKCSDITPVKFILLVSSTAYRCAADVMINIIYFNLDSIPH